MLKFNNIIYQIAKVIIKMTNKWDEVQIDAMILSVEKWYKIVYEKGIDLGSSNCACCREFNFGMLHPCVQCPISIFTNELHCINIPYMEWCATSNMAKYRYTNDVSNKMIEAYRAIDYTSMIYAQAIYATLQTILIEMEKENQILR
jgi:hypothetical protein